MKYMNGAQSEAIYDGLRTDKAAWQALHEQLRSYGYMQGGGLDQEIDGEIVLLAIYEEGTITAENLALANQIVHKGFRIKAEVRPPARAC